MVRPQHVAPAARYVPGGGRPRVLVRRMIFAALLSRYSSGVA
jgi:hypothetical protein